MKEPLLRYVACYRGQRAVHMRRWIRGQKEEMFARISRGPLKGCYRHTRPAEPDGHMRNVYALTRSSVMVFAVVIRPGWPECLTDAAP